MSKTKTAPVDLPVESVTWIPIRDVHPASSNPRRSTGAIEEMAETMKQVGVLQPLIVTPRGDEGGFRIVAGHRRHAAAQLAGLEKLPCLVRHFLAPEAVQVARLIENLQREDLDPFEEATGYQQLADPPASLSQREIAARVGRSQPHVSKHLALLKLPDKAREAVDSGRISKEEAFELTKLAEHPEAIEQALQRGRSYGGVGQAAVAIADQLQSEAKRKATRERLEKEGKRIIGEAQGGWQAGPNYPAARLEDVTRRASKKFDPVAHEKLGCHGYFIGWDGEAIPSCADSHKHQSPSRVRTDPEAERRMKEAEKGRRRDEELAARRQKHIQLLLAGKLGADARDHVVRQAIFIYEPEWELAESWLGIKRPDDNTRYDESPMAFISRWVAEAPSVRQLQAALALVLESGERTLRYLHPNADDDDRAAIRGHLEFLGWSGLELEPEEQAHLTAPLSEKDRLRAELFGPDGWGKWETGTTHPEGATKECQPTIEARTWDWGRDDETPETGHLEYRGACRGCDWRGPVQTMHAGGENAAVEDAHDHAFPGWRQLPAITWSARPDNPSKKWTEAAEKRALEAGYPADFVARRGPVRELRGGIGMRHVPGYSPFGGYAIAVAEGSEKADVGAGEAAGAAPPSSAPSTSVEVGDFDEDGLQEPLPCPLCGKLACAHTADEKATAGAAA